ncbi:MAG: hypothetical protein CVT88_06280 [Candidatus Altiarchaeales archaeon HGW-Altiarchaeales-1]|nr:MAG: hypothetical protein CVT88_06280 [Candidatus Altiarchaeales archaeon HGW-Altiarchaeales-1]
MLIYIEIPIIKTQKINFRMNKERFIVLISIITIVIAISGCIENTNTVHNISDNPGDNGLNNATCNTNINNSAHLNSTNNSDNNMLNNSDNHRNIATNQNITYDATTGENTNNVIVIITVSNDTLLKISVKNIEIYSKIYGWKTLDKPLNQTDNQSVYSGNLPAGKYAQIRINASKISAKIKISNLTPLGNASFEIPLNFSINETSKIFVNFNFSSNLEYREENEKISAIDILMRMEMFEGKNLVVREHFALTISLPDETDETNQTGCREVCSIVCKNKSKDNETNKTKCELWTERCKKVCNGSIVENETNQTQLRCMERCNEICKKENIERICYAAIEEECASGCEQNLYSADLTQRCQNEINERCRIKCESGDMDAQNWTQCNFRCKMNSLQPCVEKYVAGERNICISQCKANASSQCQADTNFGCYEECLKKCDE